MPKQQLEPDSKIGPTPVAGAFCPLSEGNLVKLAPADPALPADRRRFSMLAYSGAPVTRYWGQVVFDLTGMKFDAKRTPILKNHSEDQRVGMSEDVKITAQGLEISGFMLKKSKAAQEVIEDADDGFEWQASMGVEMKSWEDLQAGATTKVNGREIHGPAYIIRQSVLRESSFVPVGADGETSGEVLAFFKKEEAKMSEKVPAPAVDLEAERVKFKEEQKKLHAELKAAFPNDPAFALAAIEDGLTVVEAKAKYADKLAADMAAKDAEIAKLKATPLAKTGADPVKFKSGEGEPGGGEGKTGRERFDALVEKFIAEGMTKAKAVSKVCTDHPDVHQAFLAEANPGKDVSQYQGFRR